MQNSNPVEIKSAFKLGYISYILENELVELGNSFSTPNQTELIDQYLNTLLLFENEYLILLNEKFILLPAYRNNADKKDFLLATIELVKEKIYAVDDTKIELAFFAGGTLAVSYDDDLGIFSSFKFIEIMNLIFNWCHQNSSIVSDQVPKVLSSDIYECLIARNTLCNALIGSELNEDQERAFKYLDKIVVKRH